LTTLFKSNYGTTMSLFKFMRKLFISLLRGFKSAKLTSFSTKIAPLGLFQTPLGA
jgi:hypothetical protein